MSCTLPGRLTKEDLLKSMHIGNGINPNNIDAILEKGPKTIEEACIFADQINTELQSGIESFRASEDNGIGHNSRSLS
jgi:hypothetical protein